jgi:hypothetical protein
MLMDMLETMPIDFDRSGKPKMPTVVLHPDMFRSIEPKLREWEKDPELRARREAMLARKKEEWRVRESRRRLVD